MQYSHTALRVTIDEDLLPLSALLHQRGLPHRIYEEGGRQVLKVAAESQAGEVETLYRAWRNGELRIELQAAPRRERNLALPAAPVTLLLIALSILGFLLVYLPPLRGWVGLFTFSPFQLEGGQVSFEAMQGQYWRLISPAFLHFGWLHIAFNSLWMWDLGRRVEQIMGSGNMVGLFLVIALVSNCSQFLFGGPSIFGGMSGVVYGLLGFSWVGATVQPAWPIRPPRGIMVFMIGWLLICAAGITESMGLGSVANAAHFGGLLTGSLLGAAFGLLSRYNTRPPLQDD